MLCYKNYNRKGDAIVSIYEMYELLTEENKEIIRQLIEKLKDEQSKHE